MMNIELSLTIDEVNNILDALAQRPYIQVADLISKIQQVANAQLNEASQKQK